MVVIDGGARFLKSQISQGLDDIDAEPGSRVLGFAHSLNKRIERVQLQLLDAAQMDP